MKCRQSCSLMSGNPLNRTNLLKASVRLFGFIFVISPESLIFFASVSGSQIYLNDPGVLGYSLLTTSPSSLYTAARWIHSTSPLRSSILRAQISLLRSPKMARWTGMCLSKAVLACICYGFLYRLSLRVFADIDSCPVCPRFSSFNFSRSYQIRLSRHIYAVLCHVPCQILLYHHVLIIHSCNFFTNVFLIFSLKYAKNGDLAEIS